MLLVTCRNHFWFEEEIIGQEGIAFFSLVPDHDTLQPRVIVVTGIEKCVVLFTHDVALGSIDRIGISSLKLRIDFGTCNEEGIHRMELAESCEIQIATINQVIRAQLYYENVEFVDITVSDVNEASDRSSKACNLIAALADRNSAHGYTVNTGQSLWSRTYIVSHLSSLAYEGMPSSSDAVQDRRIFSTAVSYSRWPIYCNKLSSIESPCDTTDGLVRANCLQCRAVTPDKSIAQTSWQRTDIYRKNI